MSVLKQSLPSREFDELFTYYKVNPWGDDWLQVFRISPVGDDMYEKAYFGVQKILDDALGGEEEDGAGAGITADVALLAHRYQEALKALAGLPGGSVELPKVKSAQLPDPFEGVPA